MITNYLIPRTQVQKSASKANPIFGLPKNTFLSRNPSLWKKLYTTYVRLHLEYLISEWYPYTKADKKTLEKVQRRAARLSSSLKELSYLERLCLNTLEGRREGGDLIQWFKIKSKIDKVTWFARPVIIAARSRHKKIPCKEAGRMYRSKCIKKVRIKFIMQLTSSDYTNG